MEELRRYIADYNYLIGRINKAETVTQKTLNSYSEKGYMQLVTALNEIIRQAGEIQIKIERIIERKLTDYEMLNVINI